MYSRTAIVAIALVALSAPSALAAPSPASPVAKREVLELLNRELADLQAREESGALSWQGIYDWGNKVLDGLQSITPTIQTGADLWNKANARDLVQRENLARELHMVTRDVIERRADDESGALDWQDVKDFGKGFGDGFVKGFTKTVSTALPIVASFVKREDLDFIARELTNGVVARAAADESGALNWQDVKDFGKGFVDGFTKTVGTLAPIAGAFLKREELEILQRELRREAEESGALDWQDVKDFGKGFVNGFTKTVGTLAPIAGAFLKREELEMLKRELDARSADESGALNWQDVKDFGKGFVDGFTKTVGTVAPIAGAFLKREELEMLKRELEARAADESGALDWQDVKDFGKGFVDGFTKTVTTVGPIVGAFLKREEQLALLSRQLKALEMRDTEHVARSLNHLD